MVFTIYGKKKAMGIGELFHRSSKNILLVLNGFILYRVKYKFDGFVEYYKARLNPRGYNNKKVLILLIYFFML